MGALPVDVLLGQGIGAESDLEARHEVHHHHHHHDDDRTIITTMITNTSTATTNSRASS